MERYIFTSIEDIDQRIIESLDIDSVISVCQTNKKALKLCQNNTLWFTIFKYNNIIVQQGFKPKSSNDWIYYYKNYKYIKYITLHGNWIDKIDQAIHIRNDMMMINEIDNDLNYRHIIINIKNSNKYQIYKAIENITNQELEFDGIYMQYKQFHFKYRKNEYWLFFNTDFLVTGYQDDDENFNLDPNNPDKFRVQLTEEEFKIILILIIYDDNYIDIYDHDKRSYLISMLKDNGDEYNLKRIGMLQVLNYLHKNH